MMSRGVGRVLLLLTLSVPLAASAQSVLRLGDGDSTKPQRTDAERRSIERCEANRGVDCQTPQGLREWTSEERPITDRERSSAAGARRHRQDEEKRQRAAKPVK